MDTFKWWSWSWLFHTFSATSQVHTSSLLTSIYTCLDWCVSELSRMLTRACAPSPIYDEILIIYTRAHAWSKWGGTPPSGCGEVARFLTLSSLCWVLRVCAAAGDAHGEPTGVIGESVIGDIGDPSPGECPRCPSARYAYPWWWCAPAAHCGAAGPQPIILSGSPPWYEFGGRPFGCIFGSLW